MEKDDISRSEFNPAPVQSKEATGTREEFLAAAKESPPGKEIGETFGKFLDALQKEADEKFPGAERDLWFNFQLTQAYVDAQMWGEASEAVEDALTVARNMREDGWQKHFNAMLQKIDENLKPLA